MKLKALALDYDGTLTTDRSPAAGVPAAIADARRAGVSVVLVTGRRLAHLRQDVPLTAFDAIVAENGAVLFFPDTGRHVLSGRPPAPGFLERLTARRVPYLAGDVVVETDATHAPEVLAAVRALELPLTLVFNRSRLMVLPPGVSKSSGLSRALFEMRISIHNVVGIGDAENDHDLIDACESGVAVAWGSAALAAAADDVVGGADPSAIPAYLRRLVRAPRLSVGQTGRRRMTLGTLHSGEPATLAIRGRNVLIAGEPGSGKSYLAGLICEQLILQRYSLAILDAEGDYRALGDLPDVTVFGGEDPPPRVRDIMQALRHPDESIVIDLSRMHGREKSDYVRAVLPVLAQERRMSGLPHKILIDEAHQFIPPGSDPRLIDDELGGYIAITYRVSTLDRRFGAADSVIFVMKERDPAERDALCSMCGAEIDAEMLGSVPLAEAALLPGPQEAEGGVVRFRVGERVTSHVRHRQKYFDMPIGEGEAFVFTQRGAPVGRARSLRELVAHLGGDPADRLAAHFQRHDVSRWVREVFRDGPLAADLHRIESRAVDEADMAVAAAMAQAIRARYDIVRSSDEPSSPAR